jgi:hypothetical protein
MVPLPGTRQLTSDKLSIDFFQHTPNMENVRIDRFSQPDRDRLRLTGKIGIDPIERH